ncbi:MAG: HAD family hydrolase [Chloroflexi bacterium]|nr:HAD family hydrolase [Chloroflexota bacterium]
MPAIAAALFDLDDTLVDRRGAYDVFYRSFYDRNSAINDDVSWPEAKKFFWTLSPDNATDLRQAFIAIRDRWPGVEGDPESHFHSYFQSMVANMKPLPGAVELADALNSIGMPWGVVTNGGEYQLQKVVAAGLDGKVPFVIATELHGASKPDPEPYLHALRLLQLDSAGPESVLFVGDNPHTDIAGAHGVGMKTAWIHMGRSFPGLMRQPDMTISGVRDLDEILEL